MNKTVKRMVKTSAALFVAISMANYLSLPAVAATGYMIDGHIWRYGEMKTRDVKGLTGYAAGTYLR